MTLTTPCACRCTSPTSPTLPGNDIMAQYVRERYPARAAVVVPAAARRMVEIDASSQGVKSEAFEKLGLRSIFDLSCTFRCATRRDVVTAAQEAPSAAGVLEASSGRAVSPTPRRQLLYTPKAWCCASSTSTRASSSIFSVPRRTRLRAYGEGAAAFSAPRWHPRYRICIKASRARSADDVSIRPRRRVSGCCASCVSNSSTRTKTRCRS